jgi:hypothetical protein
MHRHTRTVPVLVFGFCILLSLIVLTLIGFIELEKMDKKVKAWTNTGIKRKYVHAYGHGFVQNWKEFLFLVRPKCQRPTSYADEWRAQEQAKKEKSEEEEKTKQE